MASLLIISSVEKLQGEINRIVGSFSGTPGIYVSLNKTQKGIEDVFLKNDIDTSKLFFIDCISGEDKRDDVLHVAPNNLDELSLAIKDFIKEIKGEKFLIVDAISTLLIYNSENKVAAFVKEITSYASEGEVDVVALSPATKGEDLLNKIFNFFGEVKREEVKLDDDPKEELIY